MVPVLSQQQQQNDPILFTHQTDIYIFLIFHSWMLILQVYIKLVSGFNNVLIIIMGTRKAPTLQLEVLNKHNTPSDNVH